MAQVLRGAPELIKDLIAEALREPPPRRDKRAADTLRVLGTLARQVRQLDAAEQLLREAMRRGGDDQGQVFELLLTVLWQQRKREEIVTLCAGDGGRRRFWAQTYLNYNLARACDELGRWPEALRAIDTAIHSRPGQGDLTQPFLRCRRAQILQHWGRFDDALAECEAVLKLPLKPDQAREARLALAGVYDAMREPAKAEAQLRLVLEADPSDPLANNNLGYHLADLGQNLAEAERLIRKAIDLDREERRRTAAAEEDTAAYLDSLGWVLFRRGRFDEARQWLERAARLPDGEHDPVVWDHLGDAYARLGEPARARTAWEKALPLYASERRQAGDERPAEVRRKIAVSNER
jgi:tetratricopeptide (TPR) repeat protein